MTKFSKLSGRRVTVALAVVALIGSLSVRATAQSPYLLPYTIQTFAGGGTAPSAGAACVGTNGVSGIAVDAIGDGCPVTSSSVVVGAGADVHDVGVDSQGNVYFLDNQSNGVIRRVDARSGIVSVYAGTPSGAQPTVACAVVQDKYGDGCLANDGKGNVVPTSPATYQYTANLAKARGLTVGKNGDVFLADYSGNVIHRVNLSTGLFTIVAGVLGGGTAAKPTLNTGQKGYTGDGGPATLGEVNGARGVAVDLAGNVYIADSANNVVRKVTASTGVISTIAGSIPGTAGFSGDGGPATSALLSAPEDVEVDAFGNVYIADFGNNRVRMVYSGGAAAAKLISLTNAGTTATSGSIYTVIGGGAGVYTAGTLVLSTSVSVAQTRKLALDNRGNVYLADNGNSVIWFLDATTGYMRVIAGTYGKSSGGTGCSGQANLYGDNCAATAATFVPTSAMGVAVDATGNVYITDTGNKAIRRANTDQMFPAVNAGASISQILEVHFASGDSPNAINPFALTGSPDYRLINTACTVNPDLTQDCLITVSFTPNTPGVDVASLTVSSSLNGKAIFGISGIGNAAAVALDPGATTSLATALTTPQGIAQDGAGITYIADTGNNRVLRYTSANNFSVVAGTGTAGYSGDGSVATSAKLSGPSAVAVARDMSIYIADTGNNVIRRVDPSTGIITTYGGAGTAVCAAAVDTVGDGCVATSATFSKPGGLAADFDGNVYVADTGNNLVREITSSGTVVYLAGGAQNVCAGGDVFGNGCAGTGSTFSGPTGLAVDSSRNVYVADTGNNLIREISNKGIVLLLAGTGVNGASGNGGPATGAQLSSPTGVAVDAGANLYIADTGNSVIRLVNSFGVINTTVGTLGASGSGVMPGSAFSVLLNNPAGVVVNGSGRLVILDSGNNRALSDDRGSVTYDFGRTPPATSSPSLQILETSTGSVAATLGSSLFTVTGTPGSFTLAGSSSSGCSPNQTLKPSTSCLLAAQFNPIALGPVSATYTETATNTINSPQPFITLSGIGASLIKTSATTSVTTPASGSPQYAVPFVVTTTIAPASCNTAAPSCIPTGTVKFFVDGTQVGLDVPVTSAGTASQTVSGLSVGSHSVVAVYSGDGFYASTSASSLAISIAVGPSKVVVTATPSTSLQFSDLTLTANVTGAIPTSFPIGSVSFYAGTTFIGSARIAAKTGVATLADVHIPANPATGQVEVLAQSFGLPAGPYTITAVYSGDANYAQATSAGTTITISPDPQSFSATLAPNLTGTAQGSTAQAQLVILPSNTLNGTVTFACSGMPANSVCTFSPTSLTFTPVPGSPIAQQLQVTLWTDVPSGVIPSSASAVAPHIIGQKSSTISFASVLGWPLLLCSLAGIVGFRRKLRSSSLLTLVALFGILAGGCIALTGCGSGGASSSLTPTGVYAVKLTSTGPSGTSVVSPITFTVTTGVAGQL